MSEAEFIDIGLPGQILRWDGSNYIWVYPELICEELGLDARVVMIENSHEGDI